VGESAAGHVRALKPNGGREKQNQFGGGTPAPKLAA
jgi:hypothetical protein